MPETPAPRLEDWTFTVSEHLSADPGTLWDHLAALPRIGEWSPECRWAAWAAHPGHARTGARFRAVNQHGDVTWEVTGRILEAARPRVLSWSVDGEGAPSSTWRYQLEPDPSGGTRVSMTFSHGPGGSGVLLAILDDPEAAAEIIQRREHDLIGNVRSTLRAIERAIQAGR
ncbi:SRPBCC family protein [Pseudonocardia acaciae]|uniref:SRPBCC family protein n=1 Tax=Pseudonocardia acaciae TaxID=551276 RepID=UPI00048EC9BA|nr:SRPBCC family protein [Pseudonocardia acaciae]